jgi:gluconate 2-dehydrogenase alpha chain
MMNGVGGSVIHWGGALRRFHPHHFDYLTHVRESFGEEALPEGHTLTDWPVSYDELEPYYTTIECLIGVAGNEDNPFVWRSKPYPLPPLRPFRTSEIFSKATKEMGLHPYPTPVAVNSEPYNGYPATTYYAWSGGFGPFNDERWHPGLTSVPEALATGSLDGSSPSRCPITGTFSIWTLGTVTAAGSGSPLCLSLAICERTRGALPTGWKGRPKRSFR